jgi:transcriptional regulator with XRE-family HTH domain
MSIGDRILEALSKSGKTQADLARYLSTRTSTITGWVKEGRIPAATSVVPICEFTGVSPMWLLVGVEQIETIATSQPLNGHQAEQNLRQVSNASFLDFNITEVDIDIAQRYHKLDHNGQIVVENAIIQEERRFNAERENDESAVA